MSPAVPNPLTLGDLRARGIRTISLDCTCGRIVIVQPDHLGDDVAVPEVRRSYTCSACGEKPVRSMPDWSGRTAAGMPDTRPKG